DLAGSGPSETSRRRVEEDAVASFQEPSWTKMPFSLPGKAARLSVVEEKMRRALALKNDIIDELKDDLWRKRCEILEDAARLEDLARLEAGPTPPSVAVMGNDSRGHTPSYVGALAMNGTANSFLAAAAAAGQPVRPAAPPQTLQTGAAGAAPLSSLRMPISGAGSPAASPAASPSLRMPISGAGSPAASPVVVQRFLAVDSQGAPSGMQPTSMHMHSMGVGAASAISGSQWRAGPVPWMSQPMSASVYQASPLHHSTMSAVASPRLTIRR
ncbi:unnamed protein product, partial [Polarella glacialis]